MSEARTITVAIDPELHDGEQPKSDRQRALWETLDTAWNLIREGAVRVTLADIREQLAEQGFTGMPSDEELFALGRESGDPEAPTSYLDLAPNRGDGEIVNMAGEGLFSVFSLLAEQAYTDAAAGLDLAVDE